MASFKDVLEAIRTGNKIQHDGWYDGQWIEWANQDKYLMLSPKQLLSHDWRIAPVVPVDNFVDSDDSVKKKRHGKK